MPNHIYRILNKRYPQNLMLKKPIIGTLVFLVFCFVFVTIYRPLKLHESRFFNFNLTMAVYFCVMSLPLIGLVKGLKSINYFSDGKEWNILKEIISIILILLGMGIVAYFAGFLFEIQGDRWNFATFWDSANHAILIGIVPFVFFTLVNYRYLFVTDKVENFQPQLNQSDAEQPEQLVQIVSKLKKEELCFYPSQLIYSESDGNYVVFYLDVNNHIRKEIIRNSIQNIEKQLSVIPFFMRIHRAFIINVKKVRSRNGNTLGYRLKLTGTETEIPVSRQYIPNFNSLLKRYQ